MAKTKSENPESTTENSESPAKGKISMVRCLKGNILKGIQLGEKYTVTGSARKYEIGNTTFGEFIKFVGNFAIKFRDDIYTSANLILPKVAEDLLRIEMIKLENLARETGNDAGEFQFMLIIGKEEKPKRTEIDCGYEWTCSFPENVRIEAPKNPYVQLLLEA